MPRDVTRREFVSTAALAAAAVPMLPRLRGRTPAAASSAIRPFDLRRVRLHAGPFADAQEVNRRMLLALDPGRMLHMFRVTAGLPSTAQPLGGWEAPDNELRGHFVGHYLSACALMGASTGDEAVKARGNLMVAELAKCQAALGNGYLSAFPEELFDRLRAGKPAWAPFYTIHKIMAGLLDTYTYNGNTQALDVLRRMTGWVGGWVQPLGDDHMARILEREYGGMNEVLYDLADATGQAQYRELAHRFDHERIFAPLAAGRDELKGLHANTNVPKVIGAARRYELTGEQRYRDIAEYFWHDVTSRRAYATGGTSNGESWDTDPGILSTQLSGYTQECCVSYNMLKLTRLVFAWTGDPRAADYYERTLFNSVLGTQHPSDGDKLYYVPLETGWWKLFGTPNNDFWCCTGTGAESHAKFGDSIYFHDADGVFVNQFIASEVDWTERGVRIVQETSFPEVGATRLTVRAAKPVRMALRVRVPYWVGEGGSAKLNGRPLDAFAAPSSYLVLDRTWHDGDTVELALPMGLHTQAMPDDASMQAVMYGPLVLAGRLGTEGLAAGILRAPPTKPRMVPEYPGKPVPGPAFVAASHDPQSWIEPTGARPLEFRTVGQTKDLTLVPLYQVIDERYGVYWHVTPKPA